jgi:hypothetical protein
MFKSLPQLIIHSIIGVFIQLANPKMFNSKFNEQSQVVSPKLRMRCEFKWVEVKKQPNPHWKHSHSFNHWWLNLANPKKFNSKFNKQPQVVSPKLRLMCESKWVEVKKQPNPHWKYSRLCLKETVSQCCITSQTPTTTSKEHDKLGAWWARVNQQATVAP